MAADRFHGLRNDFGAGKTGPIMVTTKLTVFRTRYGILRFTILLRKLCVYVMLWPLFECVLCFLCHSCLKMMNNVRMLLVPGGTMGLALPRKPMLCNLSSQAVHHAISKSTLFGSDQSAKNRLTSQPEDLH